MATDTHDPADLSALSPLADQVATTLARVASDIALVIDRDGVIRNVAEGGAALPASCSAWVGRRWVDTVTADTRPKIQLLLDELKSAGVSQRREVNHPNVDGDAVPVAWTAIRLGEDGPVVAVGRDLRAVAAIQRRFLDAQHEMELDYWQRRHADSRYRMLFQVASDAVLVLDAASLEVIDSNDAARERFGPGAALLGRRMADALPESARAAVGELLATARASGRAGEIRVRLAADEAPWDCAVTPFRAEERHQLLLRLRREEADGAEGPSSLMMKSLVESTPDAVVITDSAGHVQLANPAFVALVQQGSETRLKGRLLSEVANDRDGSWPQLVERTRQRGLCPRAPLVVKQGQLTVAVEVSATLLTDGDQEHLGFVVRAVEPRSAADAAAAPFEAWHSLSLLRAQIGLTPLATLMREAADAVERQFLHSAVELAGGRIDAAARLLMLNPQALVQRLRELGLDETADRDQGGPAQPTSMLN